MTDPLPPPITSGPGQHLRPPRRQYRLSDEHSPSRTRNTDDLLSRLTPMTAVEMLQMPNAELKHCLDNSTVSEQEFALRAAMASRKIYEWLEELSDWPWPATSGSAGFEMPNAPRMKLDDAAASETEYLGCLPAKDVAQYEQRVDGISHDMDQLCIEDIKAHVMHTHILPLSRPGTPNMDSRSIAAALSYNRMDDLTALLTAIIIQALPNLSKLCRLLKVWHIRLSVLRRIPALLTGIAEAEFALQFAWNVLSSPAGTPIEDNLEQQAQDDFSRFKHGFAVVKGVLEKQITKSGRSLDFMLDNLEGLQDTLPEIWLDRMEAVERKYADWVASGEQKIREGEWRQMAKVQVEPSLALPAFDEDPSTVTLPVPITIDPPQEEMMRETSHSATSNEATPEHSNDADEDDSIEPSLSQLKAHRTIQPPASGFDGSNEVPKPKRTPLAEVLNESTQKTGPPESNKQSVVSKLRAVFESKTRSESFLDDVEILSDTPGDEDEVQLPPLIRPDRRGSDASELSTVIHGHTSMLADGSSDMPEVSASPPLPRQNRRETLGQKSAAGRFMSISPPSSPPFQPSMRHDGVSPMMRPQEEGLLPALPLESSFIEEDYDHSFTSVGTPRESNASDDHLRQQISDILESIPANIKLAKATPKVDLNPPPPDLPAKRLRKPSRETIRRTGSSMSMASRASSRAPTPWLTLAPAYAKNPRPKRSQGRNDIRVYHLSRSTGEAPIKLFIRCVGEHGERVMVRVGGGWADLGEYLKEYATHHGRRSAGPVETAKVEVQDVPRASSLAANSSPPSRPASALEMSPMTPLNVRKSRKSFGAGDNLGPSVPRLLPNTPAVPPIPDKYTPSSEDSNRSRSSSHISWEEESSFLGLAGPTGRKVEMSEESRAWVESVKEKVRLASGETRNTSQFGDMGKVGGTKRLFRKG
ncbi:GAS2 domain-containing protein [Colletotrichum graminicola]|uniref:GAS2 domain-containing protein n=1 Tax=Colletotrichum graminicola (strain M1.001 / M2 / FGSC 10212) TaxID=645133 RepID=E3QFT8_COLGM|nr:GAS2 domain-containing protein [Colletotrichum graminicola M1.001]EFQ29773.1 GAS2 domain-containing protein [Colletotrichum graminicola M1.001]WDK12437.1 GAS2 domain-containing protein [Colletotrichum graminicola]